jgi:hypothetical protein
MFQEIDLSAQMNKRETPGIVFFLKGKNSRNSCGIELGILLHPW